MEQKIERRRDRDRVRSERMRRRRRSVRIKKMLCLFAVILAAAAVVFLKLNNIRDSIIATRLESKDYPQSLLDLMDRNPETTEFVLNYDPDREMPETIDLSNEVTKGEIPLFLQWDERWGYRKYGDDFLAVTGCGPTCLSMVRCGLSGDAVWNPYEVAQFAQREGYYVTGVGSAWDLMEGGARQLGLEVYDISFDADSIRDALLGGMPIICTMGPGDFTDTGHFIVLTGVDEQGNVLVADPNSRKKSEKAWDMDVLISQIRNLWGYGYPETGI